ncbi:MAG: NUDIX domain-containing protein [Coriobacteriia bacterium]|nr:NUDIX domain-containing protein [Coriobacteriia bacterium]MCL2750763.1 NUDIX domain-containing protein [Coriobacteriia bacterium]
MQEIFEYEHPFVCTDAVIFTIQTKEPSSYRKLPEANLRVLLYQRESEPFKDTWCLPGGFLNIDELPEVNIQRKLFAKTEVDDCWLEQLYTFCDPKRDPRARVISIAYLGLIDEERSREFESKAKWFDTKELSQINFGFDHRHIAEVALERLQSKIQYTNIALHLLPKEFTLTQLQNVYEAILGKKDQAANFRRKVMNMVQETERYTADKGHRPAKLYIKKRQD